MLTFGTTTLPLASWVADPRQPEESRARRLAAIRQIVGGYGLCAVELTLDLGAIFPHLFDAGFYAQVADLQQELGFLCTVHLPFLWVDPASLNESIRRTTHACLRQAIEQTRAVEVHGYVLHAWGFTTMRIAAQLQHPAQREAILSALMAQASHSIGELCQLVDPRHLCVENLEDSLFDLALPLVEQHGTSLCLDVGHLAWQGGGEIDFLERHVNRIREVHLHDATMQSLGGSSRVRDHLALGQGQFNYLTFLHKLDEIGFDGPVILELNSQQDLEQSLERVSAFRSPA